MTGKLKNHFKGLQPYMPEDVGKLFGRDKDLILMQDRIFSAKTTLLFAASGIGKTSFLNAKVIPETDPGYLVCYHKHWAIRDPLVAVKNSLATRLAKQEHDLKIDELNSFIHNKKNSLKDFCQEFRPNRTILILDQFEEIFQYHAYESYFDQFLDEICDVINSDRLQVRVIFSMREEYLGELSIFDNRIPDLFNNYYHLKHPDKKQAALIIKRTCLLAEEDIDDLSVEVDHHKLDILIDDLSKIEKEVGVPIVTSTKKADSERREIQREFIVPPYLQIVCQSLWDKQMKSMGKVKPEKFVFLKEYQAGDAQKSLREFCHEKLSTLKTREKDLSARAFDFLVTKRGAKMAFDVESLAKHMKAKIDRLTSTLQKLTQPHRRLLRKSSHPDKSLWFELYHDMFSPIVYEWKEKYQHKRRKIRRFRTLGITVAVTVLLFWFSNWFSNYLLVKTTVDSLYNDFNAVKQGNMSADSFRVEIKNAENFAPKSTEIDTIRANFDKWRIQALLDTTLQLRSFEHTNFYFQDLKEEYPEKISMVRDTIFKQLEKRYYQITTIDSSQPKLDSLETILNWSITNLGSDPQITYLLSDIEGKRGNIEKQRELQREAMRNRERQLLAAIDIKSPRNRVVKGDTSGAATQFEIDLQNKNILKNVQLFLNDKEIPFRTIQAGKLPVVIPPNTRTVRVNLKAIDNDGFEVEKTTNFRIDYSPPQLLKYTIFYKDLNKKNNWIEMPPEQWMGDKWKIEGVASEALQSARIVFRSKDETIKQQNVKKGEILSVNEESKKSFSDIRRDIETTYSRDRKTFFIEGSKETLKGAEEFSCLLLLEDQVGWEKKIELGLWRVSKLIPQSLRSEPATLSHEQVNSMIKKYGFFDRRMNENGKGFNNQFEVQNIKGEKVIVDETSGLMWQKGGSTNSMRYEIAKKWVGNLNNEKFAGYKNWRLPTLVEAMSLMEKTETNGGSYIDPIFDELQSHLWTSDMVMGESWAWVVYFHFGECLNYEFSSNNYVRAVRFGQSSKE